jgi:hypothetical protein
MRNNSDDWLIATLEPVRELLREVEDIASLSLGERVLEARLCLDRSIERLKTTDSADLRS